MFAGIGGNAHNAANNNQKGSSRDSCSHEENSSSTSTSNAVAVKEAGGGVDKDIFEEGRRQAFLLMKRDSYPRFVAMRRRAESVVGKGII